MIICQASSHDVASAAPLLHAFAFQRHTSHLLQSSGFLDRPALDPKDFNTISGLKEAVFFRYQSWLHGILAAWPALSVLA